MTTPQPKNASDLPPEAAQRLTAILGQLPAGWTVARIRPDAGGCWVAEVTDESGQVMAQVALFGG